MAVAFACLAALLAADFAYVLWRAREEWRREEDLSATTGLLISSLYALVAALSVVTVAWRPLPVDIPTTAALVIGGLAAAGGLALAAPGFVPFRSVRQLYGQERGQLITGGVYRYSRNPQYAGLGTALLGAAVIARSGLALAVVAAYWLAIRAWLLIEEAHLARAFGPEYDAYRRRAPRFLGASRR